jgi:RNA polymerase sigma-70 factor (ECF subfamily)
VRYEQSMEPGASGVALDIAALYERYRSGLQYYVTRIVGNEEDARDIVQDAFAKVLSKPAAFDPSKGRFSTWIYRVARNLALTFVRRRNESQTIHLTEEDADESDEGRSKPVEDSRVSPEDPVRTFRTRALANQCLEYLDQQPAERREWLFRYFWDSDSSAEIAQELECNERTVRRTIERARKHLVPRLRAGVEELGLIKPERQKETA